MRGTCSDCAEKHLHRFLAEFDFGYNEAEIRRIRGAVMSGDLTTSAVARQNILNNPYVLAEVEKAAALHGIPFEGSRVVLKEQVATFFEVTIRTIENHCAEFADELAESGYGVVRGERLKALKAAINALDVPEAN